MEIMDVLITILIVVMVVGGQALKIKKKFASVAEKQAQKSTRMTGGYNIRQPVSHEGKVVSKNEKFGDNSSKTSSYFTYEDVSDRYNYDYASNRPSPSMTQEINLQEVENEIETAEINLKDPEELRKAIIYGEILKNPYN